MSLLSLALASAHAQGPGVELLYTGGSGGFGPTRSNFESLRRLRLSAADLRWDEVQALAGVMVQGEALFIADKASDLPLFLDQEPRCTLTRTVTARELGLETTFFLDSEPPWADSLGTAASRQTWTCAVGEVQGMLVLPPDSPQPSWQAQDWELRRGAQGTLTQEGDTPTQYTFVVVAMPFQESARTVGEILARQEQNPLALYVDAGSFVDGPSSVQDGALSLHRPLGFATLQRLHPAALVPGENELAAGARGFFAEIEGLGLPYTACNWAPSDPSLELPASVQRTVQTPEGEVHLAFLGVVDPLWADWIPKLSEEGVTISDPIEALNAEIQRLYASDTPPDAVVLLTSANAELLSQIRRQVRGADLLIGDDSFATLRVDLDVVLLRDIPSRSKGAAITLPMDGLARVTLGFGEGADAPLRSVATEPILIDRHKPPDPQVAAGITRTRLQVYPDLDLPLLPPLSEDLSQAPDPEDWEQLVCEALRLYAHADLVVLRELPPPPSLPGPMTELSVLDSLALLDTLELHEVPGARYSELLNKLDGQAPVSCGSPLGSRPFPRARGRVVESARTYRVLTTDRSASSTAIGPALESVRSLRVLDQPTQHTLRHEDGRPVTLRHAVLSLLHEEHDTEDPEWNTVSYLLEQRPGAYDPMWLLRARTLRFSAQRFRGTGLEDTFAEVPETLATSPSSLSLSLDSDLALEHSSASWETSLRFRSSTTAMRIAGQTQESADDWRASASLAVPALAFPPPRDLRLMPYSELLFDSEFTPTEDDTGALNPRQSDLSLALGLAAGRVGPINTLRLGAFANRDLAQLADKPTEGGLRLEWELAKSFGPSLRASTLGDVQVWAHTRDDDASDLRWRAYGEARLGLPLASWLELSLYAQGFAAQGRVPETDVVGASWTAGAALNALGAWEI